MAFILQVAYVKGSNNREVRSRVNKTVVAFANSSHDRRVNASGIDIEGQLAIQAHHGEVNHGIRARN